MCIRKETADIPCHQIDQHGIRPDKRLGETINSFPTPTSLANVRSFIGVSGYYRAFIDRFAETAAPLSALLRKDVKFFWGEDQDRAFKQLRSQLSSYPVLRYPDFSRQFFVKTDYSHLAIGAVLTQFDDDNLEQPIAFLSRRCRGKESSYSARRGEAVALW